MVTVKTTGHIGPDKLLRLEVPYPESDRDVHVVVVISEEPIGEVNQAEAEDQYKEHREAAARDPEKWAGIRIPPPGAWNSDIPEPIRLEGGFSVSEQLVRDRR